MKVLFTPSGRLQFLNSVQTIRHHNRAAARRFRAEAERALKRLSKFPRSGTVILEFPELSYREIFVKPYRFFYRVHDDAVWIVVVWHGSQVPDEPADT